ncbi:MAG TPA: DUF4065 domain-containing protein [Firmicutes bacterium]|nr:DUF4065 domain-containing protein [Candidatus Fermentithermobacillaceae bacterium]
MKVLNSEFELCLCCMEKHNVDTVEVKEKQIYKGMEVEFTAIYEYCSNTNDYLENEDMIRSNSLALRDSYRMSAGLLTSTDIKNIREKYGISQKDFSEVLGWGMATITRYENSQVQDRAHDDILRKIDSDPKWFLDMLERARSRLSRKAFLKYQRKAREQFTIRKNQYLVDAIYATYAGFSDGYMTGFMELDLDKVVEAINYFARNVRSLYKVKLMKKLWYCDMLHCKRHGKSITGLVYVALPMGAVPEGHEQIVRLDGVKFDVVRYGAAEAYKFRPVEGFEIRKLSNSEIETLDKVISELGDLNTREIIDRMHQEDAYKLTELYDIIPYSYAKQLSID